MHKALVNQHLQKLGARFGIEQLQLNEQGIAGIEVMDIPLIFHHDEELNLTTVNALLTPIPIPESESWAMRLLKAQELGIDTGGCFFMLDDNRQLWLSYSIFLRFLSYEDFDAIVEQVFAYAVAWRQVVSDWIYGEAGTELG
ncbi:hypothetical protein HRbin15_02376 [bacterium HR15]|nr:hypothetical protein HRbin15_02376 [bacterium HR15]